MIDLRPATLADSDMLFAWRNDPVTLASMRSTAVVPRPDHDRWMKYNVEQGYPAHLVWMADSHVGSVGVLRFDIVGNDVLAYEASITVAPKHRCKGFATEMLRQAVGYMPEYTLHAEIRTDNAASRRAFERNGFREVGARDGFIKYRKDATA